jgi:hypothetical protein
MRSSMSTTTSQRARRDPVGGSAHVPRSRFVRHLWAPAVVAAVLVGGNEIMKASRSPGDVIRSELVAAAAELAAPVGSYPTETATRAIRRHFRAHPATLETEFWPQVSVMLHHLDKTACADASIVARRMEGLVVVELEGYPSPEDCGDDNAMTWWILP